MTARRRPDGARVGVVTGPIYEAGVVPVSHLIDVLLASSDKVYLVTGNAGWERFKADPRIVVKGVSQHPGGNLISRLARHVLIEFRMAIALAGISRKADLWIFFIGGDTLALPILTARLLGSRTALYFAGSSVATREAKGDKLTGLASLSSKFTSALVDNVVVYSRKRASAWGMDPASGKVIAAQSHYLDLAMLPMGPSVDKRPNVVGYIGRFSEEKGVRNFLKSIPLVLKQVPDARFLIAGEGTLEGEIRDFVSENGLAGRVKVSKWIPHDDLAGVLHGLKFVVMPSYTEGLPNLMLEAMAAGTIVIITDVGAVPDFLEDGRTGIILKDNSPETVASTVSAAMSRKDLGSISLTARTLVEREFTFENAKKRWADAIEKICSE